MQGAVNSGPFVRLGFWGLRRSASRISGPVSLLWSRQPGSPEAVSLPLRVKGARNTDGKERGPGLSTCHSHRGENRVAAGDDDLSVQGRRAPCGGPSSLRCRRNCSVSSEPRVGPRMAFSSEAQRGRAGRPGTASEPLPGLRSKATRPQSGHGDGSSWGSLRP